MGYYIRKSVKIGPIRLNISKRGLGISVGVKGFRYGVRPDGTSYIHAGRYGVYYRHELGGSHARIPSQPLPRQHPPIDSRILSDSITTVFPTASAARLSEIENAELLTFLNRSHNFIRTDYWAAVIGVCLAALAYPIHSALVAFVLLCAVLAFSWLALWESKRRSVFVEYNIEGKRLEAYQDILHGFNQLASCESVWILDTSTQMITLADFKANAGASSVVQRSKVQMGAGVPPWMETNVIVPTIIARNQALYFLPDCLLVCDSTGVGRVSYPNFQVAFGNTRFIEDSAPGDAQVVDKTWQHPNKNGGPDRRYSVNRELPVCLYGVMAMASSRGLCMLFHTSRSDAPHHFHCSFQRLSSGQFGVDCEDLRPSIEVNQEHFESFLAYARFTVGRVIKGTTAITKLADNLLRRISGDGNSIIHGFLRIVTVVMLFFILTGVIYLIAR